MADKPRSTRSRRPRREVCHLSVARSRRSSGDSGGLRQRRGQVGQRAHRHARPPTRPGGFRQRRDRSRPQRRGDGTRHRAAVSSPPRAPRASSRQAAPGRWHDEARGSRFARSSTRAIRGCAGRWSMSPSSRTRHVATDFTRIARLAAEDDDELLVFAIGSQRESDPRRRLIMVQKEIEGRRRLGGNAKRLR